MGRLTWTSDDGVVDISITFDGYDLERCKWETIITVDAAPSDTYTHKDAGLGTPTYDECGAMRSVVSFLGAWLEAREQEDYRDSENSDLYPEELWNILERRWRDYIEEFDDDMTPSEERGGMGS